MGKTYVDIVKYLVKANIEINGIVEKPDIVGAIFGQTEGLLGDELDLRELQKNGRIGRIEVDTTVRGGKCAGTITIPSSLDMVETSILAAALEIVDRVGPCDARVATMKIEDTRSLKRKQVLSRAKDLLKNMVTNEIPESKELSEMVRNELKISEAVSYGADALPAGPEVDSSEDLVVVEGRADVINLLKNGIKNVIAIGGANVGKTIAEVARKKETTVFLDGDRGGDIILKELLHATEIDFVARAPTGHEVEELSRKEIIQCLRRRVPIEQVVAQSGGVLSVGEPGQQKERFAQRREAFDAMRAAPGRQEQRQEPHHRVEQREPMRERPMMEPREPPREREPLREAPVLIPPAPTPSLPDVDPLVAATLKTNLKELEGSLRARILDESLAVKEEVPIRDVILALSKAGSIGGVALDGIVTQRLLDLAESKGAKVVAGIRLGNIARRPETIGIVLSQ